LSIDYKSFASAKLSFNKNYTIKLRMEWYNKVNDLDQLEVSEIEA
jgi:hypothetical protein